MQKVKSKYMHRRYFTRSMERQTVEPDWSPPRELTLQEQKERSFLFKKSNELEKDTMP